MFSKTTKMWVFYYLDENKNEVITSFKECKTPKRTENHSVNEMRMHRFGNVFGCGYRNLYQDEKSKPMVDKLTSKMIKNTIRYDRNHIMDKDSGVIYNCSGKTVGVE